MSGKDLKLTSVKVPEQLFEDFRILTIQTKFSLQKLAERSIFLYVTDPEYRRLIHNQLNTIYKTE